MLLEGCSQTKLAVCSGADVLERVCVGPSLTQEKDHSLSIGVSQVWRVRGCLTYPCLMLLRRAVGTPGCGEATSERRRQEEEAVQGRGSGLLGTAISARRGLTGTTMSSRAAPTPGRGCEETGLSRPSTSAWRSGLAAGEISVSSGPGEMNLSSAGQQLIDPISCTPRFCRSV